MRLAYVTVRNLTTYGNLLIGLFVLGKQLGDLWEHKVRLTDACVNPCQDTAPQNPHTHLGALEDGLESTDEVDGADGTGAHNQGTAQQRRNQLARQSNAL